MPGADVRRRRVFCCKVDTARTTPIACGSALPARRKLEMRLREIARNADCVRSLDRFWQSTAARVGITCSSVLRTARSAGHSRRWSENLAPRWSGCMLRANHARPKNEGAFPIAGAANSWIPFVHFALARAQLPICSDLFGICFGSARQTRAVPRRLAYGETFAAMPARWWRGIRSGT